MPDTARAATGAVAGTVRLAGPRPAAPPPLPVTVDPAACGATVPDERLVVDGAGGVRDAVVILRGAAPPAGSPSPEVLIDNVGCRFAPHVAVVRRGQTVRVRNSDPVLHNAHPVLAAEPATSIANLALGVQGQTMDLTRRLAARLPAAGETVVRLGCDVHPWMRGWLVVVDHPYATVTDAAGRFTLSEVPPGAYTLAVWHETLGRAERPVAVTAGETTDASVSLAAPH